MRAVVVAVVLASLALAASARSTVLVTSQGQPVGGRWQALVDHSRVPTVPGRLVVQDGSLCGAAAACSEGAPWLGATDRWVGLRYVGVSDVDRYDLYFELGHQFDFSLLTWADRRYLAGRWSITSPTYAVAGGYVVGRQVRRWPWENSRAAMRLGGEDGLEWTFASIYADCAADEGDQGAGVSAVNPAGVHGPAVTSRIDVCAFVRRVARR